MDSDSLSKSSTSLKTLSASSKTVLPVSNSSTSWGRYPITYEGGTVKAPLSGVHKPASMFNKVVFPTPFGPNKPILFPSFICQERFLKISLDPNDRVISLS